MIQSKKTRWVGTRWAEAKKADPKFVSSSLQSAMLLNPAAREGWHPQSKFETTVLRITISSSTLGDKPNTRSYAAVLKPWTLGHFAQSGKVPLSVLHWGKEEAQRQSEEQSTKPKRFNFILKENYTAQFQGSLYLYTIQQQRSTVKSMKNISLSPHKALAEKTSIDET